MRSIQDKKSFKVGECIGGVIFLKSKNKPLSQYMSSELYKYLPLFKKYIWPDDKKKCSGNGIALRK